MIYTIPEIKNIVSPIAERHGLKAVFLFGSYARGDATEKSDIDLLVDTAGTQINSLFTLGALYCDLQEALQKELDLITVSALEQRCSLPSDMLFHENIRKERVNLYAVT